MFDAVNRVSLAEIQSAHKRLDGIAARTPIVRCDTAPAGKEIHLKLENLQPVGSFKLRPVGNVVLTKPAALIATGIHTASSGNSALAVAWMAMRLGTVASAVVPQDAPEAKLEHLRRLGARIIKVPIAEWWRAITMAGHMGLDGTYIDAVRDPAALAGDGTVGLEILEEIPELDAIFVSFGGGGLACGIACAVRALRPQLRIIACELDTAHPMRSAMHAGQPVTAPYDSGFVSGVGFGSVLAEMWPLASGMIDGTMTVSLQEVAAAIRVMAERHKVIAEGAGAIPVAAALSGRYEHQRVCAVVSGGNLGNDMLTMILRGEIPR